MVVGSLRQETEVVVIGGGPGGYVAAIRAADLGKEVLLIDERPQLGGVCLLEGCIPSKTLIHAVEVADAARQAGSYGLSFTGMKVDTEKLRSYSESVVKQLTVGINGLLKKRGVDVIQGRARFATAKSLLLEGSDVAGVDFKQAIIATGSRPAKLPIDLPEGVWSSTEALKLSEIPERLIVIGGGYIGLELGMVYAGLGSKVTVVDFSPHLLDAADPDLVDVVVRRAKTLFENILTNSKVVEIKKNGEEYSVSLEENGKKQTMEVDRVLVAIGRKANTDDLGLENIGLGVDKHGQIPVTAEGLTEIPNIYAIGDVTPGPMLAHKASREGKIVAEHIAGHKSAFDNRAIPAVIFTDPELAWAGLTESEAKEQGVPHIVGVFPLAALGRARTLGRIDGKVKVIADPDSQLVLGVGMVGPGASDLIAEATLALEMGATLEDLMATIHPHPTLSEGIMEAAEVAAGHPVHINPPKT